jgi:hypothetical protein
MASRNLRNAGCIGVGSPQLRAHQIQSPQPHVTTGAHAEELYAALSQGSLRHTDCRAKLGHVRLFAKIGLQGVFKSRHDVRLTLPYGRGLASIARRQAFDESVNKLLLHRSCHFSMNEYFRLGLGEVASLGVKAPQLRCHAPRRSQDPSSWKIDQIQSGQYPAVVMQLAGRKRRQRPLVRALDPLMPTLAARVENDIAGPQLDAIPN